MNLVSGKSGLFSFLWDYLSDRDSEEETGGTRIEVNRGNVISWPYVLVGAIGAYFVLKSKK